MIRNNRGKIIKLLSFVLDSYSFFIPKENQKIGLVLI